LSGGCGSSHSGRFPQAAQHPALLFGSVINLLIGTLVRESLVATDGGLGNHFKAAAGGDFHKACMIHPGGSRAALCKIPREGHCCSPHLVGEAKALLGGKVPSQLIANVGKGKGFVPSIEFLQVKHGCDLPARDSTGGTGGAVEQARDAACDAAFVREALAGVGGGYPHAPGFARARGREHHPTLYTRDGPARVGVAQPAGFVAVGDGGREVCGGTPVPGRSNHRRCQRARLVHPRRLSLAGWFLAQQCP